MRCILTFNVEDESVSLNASARRSQDMLNIDKFQKTLDALTQLHIKTDHMKIKVVIVSQYIRYNKLYQIMSNKRQ